MLFGVTSKTLFISFISNYCHGLLVVMSCSQLTIRCFQRENWGPSGRGEVRISAYSRLKTPNSEPMDGLLNDCETVQCRWWEWRGLHWMQTRGSQGWREAIFVLGHFDRVFPRETDWTSYSQYRGILSVYAGDTQGALGTSIALRDTLSVRWTVVWRQLNTWKINYLLVPALRSTTTLSPLSPAKALQQLVLS